MSTQFLNGLLFGSGFTAAAVLIIAISERLFHAGIC